MATPSPADLTERIDMVITRLNRANVVEDAVFGERGVAEAASREKLLVDMSSIDPG